MTEDPGIVEPMQWLVATLITQLKALLLSLVDLDATIETLFAAQPDAEFFAALPGAGEHRYVGIAPVKESSGKRQCDCWRLSGCVSCFGVGRTERHMMKRSM